MPFLVLKTVLSFGGDKGLLLLRHPPLFADLETFPHV